MPSPVRTREIAQYESRHTTIKAITSDTTLVDADSGKLIVADITGGDVTVTLPSAIVGQQFRFVVWKSDTGNDDFILVTAATSSLFKGGVVHLDITADENSLGVEADFSNDDTLTCVDARNGTDIEVFSDGTNWYLSGRVVSDTVPTIA